MTNKRTTKIGISVAGVTLILVAVAGFVVQGPAQTNMTAMRTSSCTSEVLQGGLNTRLQYQSNLENTSPNIFLS